MWRIAVNLIETLFESGHTIAWDYISSFQFLPDAGKGTQAKEAEAVFRFGKVRERKEWEITGR